jgi:hypothetical protein
MREELAEFAMRGQPQTGLSASRRRGATFAAFSSRSPAALRSGPARRVRRLRFSGAVGYLHRPRASNRKPVRGRARLRDHIEVVVLFIVTVCEK